MIPTRLFHKGVRGIFLLLFFLFCQLIFVFTGRTSPFNFNCIKGKKKYQLGLQLMTQRKKMAV